VSENINGAELVLRVPVSKACISHLEQMTNESIWLGLGTSFSGISGTYGVKINKKLRVI